MAGRYLLDSLEQAQSAYDAGVRIIYLHGWWYRNGLYFLPDQPFDQEYTSIWNDTYSYQRLKNQVETAHQVGLKVYVYFQYAGVSEDVIGQFGQSIARDFDGNDYVVGSDGPPGVGPFINNILANPNRTGYYGASVLNQIAKLLDQIGPDGIALDSTFRVFQDDFASFDGSASRPSGSKPSRPISSIAKQGRRFFDGLRSILNAHGAQLLINGSRTLYFFLKADAGKNDQPATPLRMIFMRAMTNGRGYYIHDRNLYPGWTPYSKGRDNVFLATLIRSQPLLTASMADTDLYPFNETIPNSRLQYVIPTSAAYPEYWLFSDGTAEVQFDPSRITTLEQFEGSQFVPYPPP
jgi:hypothetical protein